MENDSDVFFVMLCCLTWTGPATLAKLVPILDQTLAKLSDTRWSTLFSTYSNAVHCKLSGSSNEIAFDLASFPKTLSPRTVLSIATRSNEANRHSLFLRYLLEYQGTDQAMLNFCLSTSLDLLFVDSRHTQKILRSIAASYKKGGAAFYRFRNVSYMHKEEGGLSEAHARAILDHAQEYPLDLVSVAEASMSKHMPRSIVPVGKIAKEQEWF